jgi:3-oxoacyl-[acyl-carrier protein] reductase
METPTRTALVTGAAGSIGTAISRAFAADGVRVILVDLDAARLEALAASLPAAAYPLRMDIADPADVAAGCRRAAAAFGPVDILVNNAGILSNNKLLDTTIAEWRRVLAVNLDGAFLLSQQVLPHLKEQRWGRIINIASFAWKSGGLTSGTAYSASKAGLVGLTFTIAKETAALGITVNGIAPTYVMTPMVTQQLTEAQRQAQLAAIPVRRFCEPEEVAHTVRFLASPLAGFITGEIIDMNGGFQFD